jgi:pSer/pThr/pTyr-binding forkhead associated (FHA) protein
MHILLEITNGPYQGREAKLHIGQSLSIGRTQQADMALPRDEFLSRRHCEVLFDGNTCHLTDLDSSNGTYYQNDTIDSIEIQDGDYFTAGNTIFRVRFIEDKPQTEELPEQNLLEFLKAQPLPLFILLDAARDEQVWKFLEPVPADAYQCLFTDRQARSLGKYGPYLLALTPESELLPQLLPKAWGESWGLFLSANCEFAELLQHLRQFLLVKDQATGKERYFRFYDPRVLRRFLPTCLPKQLKELFGPVHTFLMEDADPTTLLEFTLADKKLHRRIMPVTREAPPDDDDKTRLNGITQET